MASTDPDKTSVGYMETVLNDGTLENRRLDQDANQATEAEHATGFAEAFRKHKKVCFSREVDPGVRGRWKAVQC